MKVLIEIFGVIVAAMVGTFTAMAVVCYLGAGFIWLIGRVL